MPADPSTPAPPSAPLVDFLRHRLWDHVPADVPLWPAFGSRTIRGPSGYADPRLFPAANAMSLSIAFPGYPVPPDDFDTSSKHMCMVAREAWKFQSPRYFVNAELLEACNMTRLDVGSMQLSDIQWPLGCMAFYLPIGSVLTPSNGDLLYAGFALVGEGFAEVGGVPLAYPLRETEPSIVFFGQTRYGAIFSTLLRMSDPVSKTASYAFDPGASSHRSIGVLRMGPDRTKAVLTGIESSDSADKDCLLAIVALVVRLVLAINSAPELVEEGREVKPYKESKGRVHPAEFSPNFLGRHFKAEREAGTGGGSRGPGVEVHWRLGHYRRRQHYGPGNSLIRTVWIRPVLVGAAAAAGVATL